MIPPRCPLTPHRGEIYSGFTSRLRVLRLLGCSQREGVATCLLSVLLQPSCGPTLVDFTEITWHPHWGWLRGGSAPAGLCHGQQGPPPLSPAAFSPLPFQKGSGWCLITLSISTTTQLWKVKKLINQISRFFLWLYFLWARWQIMNRIYSSPLQFSVDKYVLVQIFFYPDFLYCIHK